MATLESMFAEHLHKWKARIKTMRRYVPISPTSLSTFRTCPKQFEAKYITKTLRYVETPEQAEGNRVHSVLEKALRDGDEIPPEYEHLAILVPAVYGLANKIKASIAVETQDLMCIGWDGRQCSWRDWDNKYLYAKADAALLSRFYAIVLDWKTGKVRPDELQCLMMGLILLLSMPELKAVESALCFTAHNQLIRMPLFKRTDLDTVAKLISYFDEYNEFQLRAEYTPKPSGLCRSWCEVDCPHNHRNEYRNQVRRI